MRIALMATCLADVMAPDVARSTVELLERLGHEVVFDKRQTCCGQMHTNTGYFREAAPVVRQFVDVFEPQLEDVDAIVMPSGSCAGAVRDQHALVARRAGDADLEERAGRVSAKTYELSELLVDVLKVTDVGAYFPHTVTYHPTCHSMRFLKVGPRPLRLLRAVEGITVVNLPESDTCCGFGGTFSVKNAETSNAMVTDKANNVVKSGADFVVAGDASCLMNIGGKLARQGQRPRPIHLAQILNSTKENPFVPSSTLLGRAS
ncbi:(Fe-S)-binding protein [Helcobacillus massiliensis]|uniref:(Fe-S)-binding protein n=1 Tax=Helcobacillus TaxID=1161125 RepID=UPI001EF4B5BB|nr:MULTISPECIES: (Fe-S)-binding protein [Helcobacillus]MCG7426418.1 (Fe-S)-binding protein [Helcobacillus sp. ACRRO]MCT1558241.1 (Fe-S)-binding protein [Helcobacillus massiliensis]MCT2035520.1 (Fe-S)-binding protein [Helcobacillus massiliensis]MCT2331985.1 (Fe-S)-binding protein [Helcobacillus massiliensis]MDK7742371.1 (Fe-S)-binding protein [Helcobacillus massiliensis]